MKQIGQRVQHEAVVRQYGRKAALVGTVTRVYASPEGMVQVRWDDDEMPEYEDIWSSDLK